MAISSLQKTRFYPKHPTVGPDGKTASVNPDLLNQHQRLAFDNIYDLQTAVASMTGGATAFSTISGGGAVTAVIVMYPGFGYTSPPKVAITGGGGSGAKATARITTGRVSSVVVTTGGAGYTSAPVVTLTP
jgi:hypothetical protein